MVRVTAWMRRFVAKFRRLCIASTIMLCCTELKNTLNVFVIRSQNSFFLNLRSELEHGTRILSKSVALCTLL